MLRTDKICKIHQIQIVLQKQIKYKSNPNPTGNPMGNNNNNYIHPRRPRFPGKCNHCRKWGYRREDCWFLKNQFSNAERANICILVSEDVPKKRGEEEVVLINEIPTLRNEESGLNEIRNDVQIAN